MSSGTDSSSSSGDRPDTENEELSSPSSQQPSVLTPPSTEVHVTIIDEEVGLLDDSTCNATTSSNASFSNSPGSLSLPNSAKSPGATDSTVALQSPGVFEKKVKFAKGTKTSSDYKSQKNETKFFPKNIPLSRVSNESPSSEDSVDVSSVSTVPEDDPRTSKKSYATLGDLVFSRCSFSKKDNESETFKDRAEELREKVKQRKADKEKQRDKKATSSTVNLDDDLIKDLEKHTKRDVVSKKQSKFPQPSKSTGKASSSSVTINKLDTGKVSKKKLTKGSKVNKLDLLEEYAQMLRDAIKHQSDSDEESSSSSDDNSNSRKHKSKKKKKKKLSHRKTQDSDEIMEVIKLEAQSNDEMDVDTPSPQPTEITFSFQSQEASSGSITIKEEPELDVVCVKQEPDSSQLQACCGSQASALPIPASNIALPVCAQSSLASSVETSAQAAASNSNYSILSSDSINADPNQAPKKTRRSSARERSRSPPPPPPPPPPPMMPGEGIIPFPPPSFISSTRSDQFPVSSSCFQSISQPPPAREFLVQNAPPAPFQSTSTAISLSNQPSPGPSFYSGAPPGLLNMPPHLLPPMPNQMNPPAFQPPQMTANNMPPPPYTPFPTNMQFRNPPPNPPSGGNLNQNLPTANLPPPLPHMMSSNSGIRMQSQFNGAGNFNFQPPMFDNNMRNNITGNVTVQQEAQLPNLKPVAQVNSTIVLDPNNPRAPLTFNTKLTSYIPESFAAAQITPTFSTANLSNIETTTMQSSPNLNSSSTACNISSSATARTEPETQQSRQNESCDRGSLGSHARKRPNSPNRDQLEIAIDFSKDISFESFLGKGLGVKPRTPKISPVKKRDNVFSEFDFVAFKNEMNQQEWMAPSSLVRKRHLDRSLIVSTNAFGYYSKLDENSGMVIESTSDQLKQLQRSFEILMKSLSRGTVSPESEMHEQELQSVMSRLTSLTFKNCHENNPTGGHSERKSGQNKKNAEVMLKQLRINVVSSGSKADDEMWKSNLDSLFSSNPGNERTIRDLPGEVYHSKNAKARRKRLKGPNTGATRRSMLMSKIDSFIDQSDLNDELISEKLKLDYVKLRRNEKSRLHHDIYPNEKGFFCDRPACTCLGENKQVGPHHGVFHNDPTYKQCNPESNNLSKLYHYYIDMTPKHHFFLTEATKIPYDGHNYTFNGFSLFSHEPLNNIPAANFTKGKTQYSFEIVEEPAPTSFSIRDCDLLSDFIFYKLLEFFDFSLLDERSDKSDEPYCRKFHFLPRFERDLPESGIEVLSAHVILRHVISSFAPLFAIEKLNDIRYLDATLRNRVAVSLKDYLVYYPGMKPTCVRVDNLSFRGNDKPVICHTSLLPSALSFLGDKKFINMKKLYAKIKETMHFRNDPTDQDWLAELDRMMNEHKRTKRATLVCDLPAENCYFSGLKCDITHCAVYLPRIVFHIRRHLAIQRLCKKFDYVIQNPLHFEAAFTHSSASENVMDGTNKSHMRASRYRVGKNMNDVPIYERAWNRKLKAAKHKRNLFTMIQTMRSLPRTESEIVDYPTTDNYERIEFLGDAVLEMIVTTHLFFMLPEAKEGILSLFRISLVANSQLSKVSKKAGLHRHLLISHDVYFNLPGPREKIHADILESFLGAVFLDSGLTEADRIFTQMFFPDVAERAMWMNLKPHEYQNEFPDGDRHLIGKCETLKKLTELEGLTGIKFKHISLLARALTPNSIGHNFLSGSNNERLELLGDTVMKLLVTDFIYRHFPVYHENHLSTLRGNLVSRFVQEEVTKELRLSDFTLDKLCAELNQHQSCNLVTAKRKADLFEAFLAAVFIDQGLETCQRIFKICIFPKIPKLLKNQKWLTPHLMLHCCFLAIRSVADLEKSLVLIPSYRVLPNNDSSVSIASLEHSKSNSKDQSAKFNSSANNQNLIGVKRVGVFVGGKMFGVGVAKSLNQAAVQACREALSFFQSKHPNTLATMLNERVDSILSNKDAIEAGKSVSRELDEEDFVYDLELVERKRPRNGDFAPNRNKLHSNSKHNQQSTPSTQITTNSSPSSKDKRTNVHENQSHFENNIPYSKGNFTGGNDRRGRQFNNNRRDCSRSDQFRNNSESIRNWKYSRSDRRNDRSLSNGNSRNQNEREDGFNPRSHGTEMPHHGSSSNTRMQFNNSNSGNINGTNRSHASYNNQLVNGNNNEDRRFGNTSGYSGDKRDQHNRSGANNYENREQFGNNSHSHRVDSFVSNNSVNAAPRDDHGTVLNITRSASLSNTNPSNVVNANPNQSSSNSSSVSAPAKNFYQIFSAY
ncbi:ribonuclease 3-like [Symsagittifera roscoffensis]|uniref:ribonuclease 3-like n=1 Tax=Symsagittifera roscoffensis TaxID=84072 RepID=UPI00307C2BFF